MFNPKCYTLKNKMYDPKKEIMMVRNDLRKWVDKVENITSVIEFNQILDKIILNIEEEILPDKNINYYNETLEGWQLIKKRNQLEKEYPRIFTQVVNEEKKEILKKIRNEN